MRKTLLLITLLVSTVCFTQKKAINKLERLTYVFLLFVLLTPCNDNTSKVVDNKSANSKVECFNEIFEENSNSRKGQATLLSFEDTLISWKNIMPKAVRDRYIFEVEGLISCEDGKKGIVFLLGQRTEKSVGGRLC